MKIYFQPSAVHRWSVLGLRSLAGCRLAVLTFNTPRVHFLFVTSCRLHQGPSHSARSKRITGYAQRGLLHCVCPCLWMDEFDSFACCLFYHNSQRAPRGVSCQTAGAASSPCLPSYRREATSLRRRVFSRDTSALLMQHGVFPSRFSRLSRN